MQPCRQAAPSTHAVVLSFQSISLSHAVTLQCVQCTEGVAGRKGKHVGRQKRSVPGMPASCHGRWWEGKAGNLMAEWWWQACQSHSPVNTMSVCLVSNATPLPVQTTGYQPAVPALSFFSLSLFFSTTEGGREEGGRDGGGRGWGVCKGRGEKARESGLKKAGSGSHVAACLSVPCLILLLLLCLSLPVLSPPVLSSCPVCPACPASLCHFLSG